MCQLKNVAAYLLVILFSNVVIAAENSSEATKQQETLRGPAEFQKVVDDYKAYAATVPSEIRDEIIAYRKEIAKLNKEKKLLYKKLSGASQDFLKKERQYKQKLPLDRKSLITIDDPTKKDATSAR